MRFLLTGANGQVGHALQASLAPIGELLCATRDGHLAVDGTSCEVADLGRPQELVQLIHRLRPDVVINAAAYTAVDRAETDRVAAFRVNAEAVGALATACAKRGALLVHYSTDYVFPGDDPRPRREDDPVGPLNVYGASKLAGEEALQASGCRHVVFRVSWVYSAHGNNFLRTMLSLAKERDRLRVVNDQFGSPTPASWIADVTARTLSAIACSAIASDGASPRSGIWHVAPAGKTSWHGFAEKICDQAARSGIITRRPKVIPVTSSEFLTAAQRPTYSLLDTSRLEQSFGILLPTWQDGLSEVMASGIL